MKKVSIVIILFVLWGFYSPAYAQTAKDLYEEGVRLKKDKKVKEAETSFKAAILLQNNYTEALYELGWCQNDLKNHAAALNTLRKVRPVWSNVPKVFFEIGYAFEKLQQLDSAIKSYNRCLELKPDYKGAYKQLGFIDYEKDDYAGALEKFRKYEELMTVEISDYLYWYRKGFMQNAQKNYADAKASLSKSLLLKKDNLNTYLELGYASSRLKENDLAISQYKKAIELGPNDYVAYNGIGEIYRDNIKDRNEAMRWYTKSLAIKPKERKACFGMGFCLNSQKKFSEAVDFLITAIQQEPDYTAAYVELGYSYYQLDRNSEAIENLNKARGLNPKNENCRYYATLLYIKMGNKSMAQKMVDELKDLGSKYSEELQLKINRM